MVIEIEKKTPLQFSIAASLLIIAAIAGVVGLGKLWEECGGLYLAIPAAIIPFSIVVEFALRRKPQQTRTKLSNINVAARVNVIVVASALPAVAGWIGLANQGSWWSPCPHLMFIAYAYLEPWLVDRPYLPYVVPSVAFLLMTIPSAFSSKRELPVRSITVLTVASLTSIYWFCSSITDALDYQSIPYIIETIAVNFTCGVALWLMCVIRRRRFNFGLVVAWNVAMFIWLFGVAYPWLGEYI